ncbi:MAG: sigma-70 family RNA polymerase sigma factor [Myxococcota bacterium]
MQLTVSAVPGAKDVASRSNVEHLTLVSVSTAPYRRGESHRLPMREFLDTYAALIVRYSRAELGNGRRSLEAGDVAHEVIESLLRLHREGSFDPRALERPEAYLRVVVRRAAQRARLRSRRAGEVAAKEAVDELAERSELGVVDDVPTPEQLTGDALDARYTLTALKQKLRPRDAAAFALLVEDGLSIEETAAALGTTPNNVYQMRHRILAVAREFAVSEAEPRSLAGGQLR